MSDYNIQSIELGRKTKDSLLLHWHVHKIGFGSLHFELRDNFIYCDNEGMSKEFIYKIIDCFFEWIPFQESGISPITFQNLKMINLFSDDNNFKPLIQNKTNKKEVFNFVKNFKENIITIEELDVLIQFNKLRFKDALKDYKQDKENLSYQFYLEKIISDFINYEKYKTKELKNAKSLEDKIALTKLIFHIK